MKQRTWPVLLASLVGLIILLTLGIWQVQRLAWKQNLINAANAAIASEAIPLDEALALFLAGKNIDYMKVKAKGRFAVKEPLRLLTSTTVGPSWQLVHGFEQANGSAVLVSRGKVADGQPLPPAPSAETEITGHLIWHDQGRGFFDVDNKPDENRWYWWDVVAMTNQFAATHLNPNYAVVHLVPGAPGTEGLIVDEVKANLRNNHLGYAITWFGLAAALLVMTGIFLYRPRHSGKGRNLSDR